MTTTQTGAAAGERRPRAVITGASAGLGVAFAERLARDGYDLIIVARRRDRLVTLAEQLATATGAQVDVVAADLTERAALHAAVGCASCRPCSAETAPPIGRWNDRVAPAIQALQADEPGQFRVGEALQVQFHHLDPPSAARLSVSPRRHRPLGPSVAHSQRKHAHECEEHGGA